MNAQRTVQIIRPSSELSTEDQKIKAAAYCRVSTDSDDQENSFLAQVKYYSDYIGSREDMILVDIYADEGITGTAMSKREAFHNIFLPPVVAKIASPALLRRNGEITTPHLRVRREVRK